MHVAAQRPMFLRHFELLICSWCTEARLGHFAYRPPCKWLDQGLAFFLCGSAKALRGHCVLRRGKGLPPLSPHPFPLLAASFLRCAPGRFLLTKPNTSCTIELPASLRSDGVRVHPGTVFGFPPEYAFSFAGILIELVSWLWRRVHGKSVPCLPVQANREITTSPRAPATWSNRPSVKVDWRTAGRSKRWKEPACCRVGVRIPRNHWHANHEKNQLIHYQQRRYTESMTLCVPSEFILSKIQFSWR
jgi:hypothetical protein